MGRNLANPGTGHTIIFNQIIINMGTNYNPSTGVFTCTQAGVHVFSWRVGVYSGQSIDTALVRNGVMLMYSTAGDQYLSTAGSATATMYLTVGDRIWVRVTGHSATTELIYVLTTFTGFRIQ